MAGIVNALTTITIAIGATGDTRPAVIALNTEGLVLGTAGVIVSRITGEAVTVYALARVGVITVVIGPTINALIAIITDDTIGRVYSAAIIGTQLTGLALAESTEWFIGVIALEVTLAITTEVSVGRLDA